MAYNAGTVSQIVRIASTTFRDTPEPIWRLSCLSRNHVYWQYATFQGYKPRFTDR